MQAQQQLIQNAKEEAEATRIAQQAEAAASGKVNVLDIKVEDDFNIDDIWRTWVTVDNSILSIIPFFKLMNYPI